ncbi:MAG: Hpt domain-containing protein [Sphingomonadales bacterium]|nr:Hpt domain-containing protein [Sphingomonadales bacterium]
MAENLISTELLDSYLTYTAESLTKLEKHLGNLQSQEAEDPQLRRDIFGICHDIKGMGGSFNYPLMTDAGTSICHYLRKLDETTPTENNLIEAHVKTMRVIIDNNITGSGGDTGKQLIDRLNELVEHSLA